jgi:putative transposase
VYLAIVLDVYSRRVVGWAIGQTMHTQLVLDALQAAAAARRPKDVIHPSDQGSQYTSLAFGKRCKLLGVRPSMGTVGDAYDNAMAESFFASLECELIDRSMFRTKAEASTALFTWIEGWYNPRRRHPAVGYRSPTDCEARHANRPGLPTAAAPAEGAAAAADNPAVAHIEEVPTA